MGAGEPLSRHRSLSLAVECLERGSPAPSGSWWQTLDP